MHPCEVGSVILLHRFELLVEPSPFGISILCSLECVLGCLLGSMLLLIVWISLSRMLCLFDFMFHSLVLGVLESSELFLTLGRFFLLSEMLPCDWVRVLKHVSRVLGYFLF